MIPPPNNTAAPEGAAVGFKIAYRLEKKFGKGLSLSLSLDMESILLYLRSPDNK
jgi:hypothetical protein